MASEWAEFFEATGREQLLATIGETITHTDSAGTQTSVTAVWVEDETLNDIDEDGNTLIRRARVYMRDDDVTVTAYDQLTRDSEDWIVETAQKRAGGIYEIVARRSERIERTRQTYRKTQ